MSFPNSDVPLPWVDAAISAASDRPIWVSSGTGSHNIRLIPWNDPAFNAGNYIRETTGKYGTAPFITSAEPANAGGYVPGTGFGVSNMTHLVSAGKVIIYADWTQLGPGIDLSTTIHGCTIHDGNGGGVSPWILTMISFGQDFTLVSANQIKIAWPASPYGNGTSYGTVFNFQ